MQGTIGQFQTGEAKKPKITTVDSKWESDTASIGYDGIDNRKNKVTVSVRQRSKGHRYEKKDCYAFDKNVLQSLRESGVETVYVVDEDVGDLFEFRLDQFFNVNDAVEINHGVPQLGVPIQKSTRWTGYAKEFMKSILF